MAVHLLEGQSVGRRRQAQIIGQREHLLALGTITAGLTHQLNNPAAAIARDIAGLRANVGKMRHKLAMLADGSSPPTPSGCWCVSRRKSPSRWPKPKAARAHRTGDFGPRGRGGRIGSNVITSPRAGTTLRHSSRRAWTPIGLNGSRASVDAVDCSATLQSAIGWLKYTIDTELAVNRVAEATNRISALFGRRQAVLPDGPCTIPIRGCPRIAAHIDDVRRKVGKNSSIKLIKDFWIRRCPKYIAIQAISTRVDEHHRQRHSGDGRCRTHRQNTPRHRRHDQDEIGDDGPGIDEDIVDRIFTPFFTHPPVGRGTGPGRTSPGG